MSGNQSRGVLAHEWIERTGGAEKVLDQFSLLAPGSDILCLWNDAPDRYAGHRVYESWMAKTRLRRKKSLALPFMSHAWRQAVNRQYDWALVSSYAFAHHLDFKQPYRHVEKYIYVHSPARYLWAPELDPRGLTWSSRALGPSFRRLDRARAQIDGNFAANSGFVSKRIEAAWGLQSRIIYPPVDVTEISEEPDWVSRVDAREALQIAALPDDFILGASRLVPYKALDRVIEAGDRVGLPVVIVGDGPEAVRLRHAAARARVPVHFMGRASDEMLYSLYQRSTAYFFPPVEDFGIMPVEAMAAGARVIANREGGTAESVVDGVSGTLCNPMDPVDVVSAIDRASRMDRELARKHSLSFSAERFRAEMRNWVPHLSDR